MTHNTTARLIDNGMNYAIQCRDVTSGQVGDFLFDEDHYVATGEFKAIGPVFPDLASFYRWDNENGHKRRP